MVSAWITGIGVLGPGLDGWRSAQSVFRGDTEWDITETPRAAADLLPPNERRRAGAAIRLALHVAREAVESSRYDVKTLPTVFSSCHGDIQIAQKNCQTLSAENPYVSPTLFHNSVHNAPSGYWHIATESQQPSNSISGGNESFALGLIESLAMLSSATSVLLVCSDSALPKAFQEFDPITIDFGVAVLLTKEKPNTSLGRLGISENAEAKSKYAPTLINEMMASNPAARSLPLLQGIVLGKNASISTGAGSSLHCVYKPC